MSVYSLNVPVPSAVARRAGEIARSLKGARPRERGTRTLLVKRLHSGDDDGYHAVEARIREALAGTAPFGVRVDRVDLFERVSTGTAPVVYLAVESPALFALHDRLCDTVDPVSGLEGPEYTPHVTVARGGSIEAARRVVGDIEPIEWTVEELAFYDAEREAEVGRVALPA